MTKRVLAILAATGASFIYGINHSLAKGVMPDFVGPFALTFLRVIGALILFWTVSFFVKSKPISRKDWPRLLACTIFGLVINMLMFFKGLSFTTPINSSVIVTISPIIVFVLSAILIREKITWLKIIGVIIGLLGALILVVFSSSSIGNSSNIPLGNLMVFINAVSYGLYLILVRPLVAKYNSVTLMKWLFLAAVLIQLPICYGEFSAINWTQLTFSIYWRIGFVVIGATFFTYLLNIFALKELSASTLGVFVYLQPVIAIAFAILTNVDKLGLVNIIAIILVFIGVFIVSKNPPQKRKRPMN